MQAAVSASLQVCRVPLLRLQVLLRQRRGFLEDGGRQIGEDESEVRRRLGAAFESRAAEQKLRLESAARISRGEELPESVRDAIFTPVSEAFTNEDRAVLRRPPRDIVRQPPNPRVMRLAVIGAPNAGKSSLVNNLVGDHVSAVASREHVTQSWTKCMTTHGDTQLIFLDTPAITHPLPVCRKMREDRQPQTIKNLQLRTVRATQAAWDSLHGCDAVIVVTDGSWGVVEQRTLRILSALRDRMELLDRKPSVYLALSRMDLLKNKRHATDFDAVELANRYAEESAIRFAAKPFRYSVKEASSLQHLLRMVALQAPPGEWVFPQGQVTDLSLPERVEELIREKVHRFMKWEDGRINHAPLLTRFSVVGWTPRESGSLDIDVLAVFAVPGLLRQFRKYLSVICDKTVVAVEKTVDRKARVTFHCTALRADIVWEWPNPYRFYGDGQALLRGVGRELLLHD